MGAFVMASVLPPSPHGGADLLTAFTSVITTMGNVGPAMGIAGPSETYTTRSTAGKLVLSLCIGRPARTVHRARDVLPVVPEEVMDVFSTLLSGNSNPRQVG